MEKKQISYVPQGGVCSKKIRIEVASGLIENVQIEGGCHGNLQGLSALLKGMAVSEAISRMSGIDCRGRGTSCPDQIAKALMQL
ncbi:MAG: TIGR03905 family TSCPD domain-containing protein [Bacteroidales bacterium]